MFLVPTRRWFRLELPRLTYTVCTDGTLMDLYTVQQGRSFWDGHKDSDLKVGFTDQYF